MLMKPWLRGFEGLTVMSVGVLVWVFVADDMLVTEVVEGVVELLVGVVVVVGVFMDGNICDDVVLGLHTFSPLHPSSAPVVFAGVVALNEVLDIVVV